ncbi:formylglycine-generating enzyme family protein [Lederbergia lenta]|uniref:Cytoplasmic protein n=1 Tax=Lederbergia lenta TaxID=1467 RepID=A0A2X4WBH6_LEDLE|nr:SUMF1/EgtB/PvdO family nonheme iron enzyme [Lederbergia lenta]MCM3109835.1 formylglycine-generating enzyme family protein [Lederbergia lenta]MEC2324391.1 SUMF1/EgtB/PvdO family nonheme iron enzyme [Lederbergia lenta]SQI60059.1 cytoplasmic protein [Lederbergia lenta]
MIDNLNEYLKELMVYIPEGEIRIRDFQDDQKWISSNYKFGMPGIRKNLKEVIRNVEIKSFYLGKYAVTEELYEFIMQKELLTSKKNQKPVVNVSWLDAVFFCNLLSETLGYDRFYDCDMESKSVVCNYSSNGFRLPTDAEWQYACKAKSKGYRYGQIDEIAWYKDNSNERVHVVGEKAPNEWGLYDMIGNIWEWCWDLYDEEKFGNYRIIRGGSWAEEERGCGATCRRKSMPDFNIDDIGFRIAKSTL